MPCNYVSISAAACGYPRPCQTYVPCTTFILNKTDRPYIQYIDIALPHNPPSYWQRLSSTHTNFACSILSAPDLMDSLFKRFTCMAGDTHSMALQGDVPVSAYVASPASATHFQQKQAGTVPAPWVATWDDTNKVRIYR